jgi:mevalonate kinase
VSAAGHGHGHGHGKVIVLGEHAAVYGHAAVAGAIDRGVDAIAVARPGPLTLAVTGAFAVAVTAGDDHPVAAALATIAEGLGGRDGAAVTATATVPAGAGLGSSAALCVAIVRALADARGLALDDRAVAELANRAERAFHGTPSGLDAALASAGGLGRFARGVGLTAIAAPPLPLVIGLSGQPRSTAAMVARVADARAADPVATDARLAALGALADAAVAQLAAGAAGWPALGGALDAAHAHLAALGVSTARLDALVALARGAGALGAKLTGGGGGGAVIALAPDRADAVLAAWRAAGADGFVATLGGPA